MQRKQPDELTPGAAVGLVLLLCGLCAGCTERDVINHPGLDAGEDGATDSAGAEADGGLIDRQGNFPEPAQTFCGALPPEVDPIPGLATAWAAAGPVMGADFEGNLPPGDGVRLRFADFAAECTESFGSIIDGEACVDAWGFALSLPLATLAVGVYDLPTLAGLYPEMHVSMGSPEGCAGGGIGGGGGLPGSEISGELEIYSVSDECIVGELRGLQDITGDLDIDRNGGFVAMRCAAACVPSFAHDCGD